MKKNLFLLMILLISLSLYSQIEDQTIMFSVSVTGMVEQPGVYHLPPTSRISEAITAANLLNSQMITTELRLEDKELPSTELETLDFDNMYLPEKEEDIFEYSTRTVVLRRNGEETILDLEAFYSLGIIEQNPYIKDGDVIYIQPKGKTVNIIGEINKPGFYEILDGESLEDLIVFAQGFTSIADTEKIEVTRKDPKNGTLINETISFNDNDFSLENLDYIVVTKQDGFLNESTITVHGNELYNGTYSIIENETTLLEILNKLNIDTEIVDLRHSFIQRTNKNEIPDPEFERLKLTTSELMTFDEYAYFKSSVRNLKGKFSLNLEELYLNNKDLDITLKDGDFIYLSGNVNTVMVMGEVKHPGLVTYVPGKNYQYYIDMAGGLAMKAKKNNIRVIRGNTDEWLKPKKQIINPGDVVFVPEKIKPDYWKIFRETVSVLAQIGTLILVIDNATN